MSVDRFLLRHLIGSFIGVADWFRASYLSLVGLRAFYNRGSMKLRIRESQVSIMLKVDRHMHLDQGIDRIATRLTECSLGWFCLSMLIVWRA